MYIYIYTYKYKHTHTHTHVYIYIYMHIFISKRVIFRFLPNLRKLNNITKSVKSINLETNKGTNKTAIKSNAKIFPINN